jgi:sugar phosphate isomerase/epimerase
MTPRQKAATTLFFAMAVALAKSLSADSHIASPDFPSVRWGFTTVNFLPHVPTTVASSKAHIDFAKSLGFGWIELRDPDAALTPDECREIAAHARHNGIAVSYSAQRGLLAEDFWEVFERAAANTAVFDGPRTIRVLALRGSGDEGWNDAEFAQMIEVANEGARRAAATGLRFAVENADAALDGRGQDYRGMTEFLSTTEPRVLLQLDTANLFTGPVETTPEAAADFIRTFAGRVAYVHLKSARDGKPMPVIANNPLRFGEILKSLSAHGAPPVVLELASAETAHAAAENIRQSLENLAAAGLLRRPDPAALEASHP